MVVVLHSDPREQEYQVELLQYQHGKICAKVRTALLKMNEFEKGCQHYEQVLGDHCHICKHEI